MPRRPRISGRELVRVLARAGFSVIRVRGSHHVLQHADGRTTVVPAHGGETIGIGLMAKILADCEMTWAQLERLHKR